MSQIEKSQLISNGLWGRTEDFPWRAGADLRLQLACRQVIWNNVFKILKVVKNWDGSAQIFRNQIHATIEFSQAWWNVILAATPVEAPQGFLNSILAETLTTLRPEYRVYLDGVDITARTARAEVVFDEDQFANEMRVTLADWDLFQAADPADLRRFGQERVEIRSRTGGGAWVVQGRFFVESRRVDVRPEGGLPVLSGRNRTALLAHPYAEPISKTWGQSTGRDVARELCDACGVSLDWRIEDFPILHNSFSAANEVPAQILDRLVRVVGAGLRSTKAGYLVVRRKQYG